MLTVVYQASNDSDGELLWVKIYFCSCFKTISLYMEKKETETCKVH